MAVLSRRTYLNVKYLFSTLINIMLFIDPIPGPVFDRFVQLTPELSDRILGKS